MLTVHEKTVFLGEWVNFRLQKLGKTLSIPFCEINESGLPTTGATALALEVWHKRKEAQDLFTARHKATRNFPVWLCDLWLCSRLFSELLLDEIADHGQLVTFTFIGLDHHHDP